MAKLPLSLIMSPNDRSTPLLDGSVQPEGIELTTTTSTPGEIFWRQLHSAEFDVSEMSLSSLYIVTAKGNSPWVAIPAFPSGASSTPRFSSAPTPASSAPRT